MKPSEFDFRIWDKESRFFIYGRDSVGDLSDETHEIELWTGFYDKNGAKIYEGDLIRHEYWSTINEVKYNRGAFILWQPENEVCFFWMSEKAQEGKLYRLEIIGNIHESDRFVAGTKFCKELLK